MSSAITKAIKALREAQDECLTKCELNEILNIVYHMKIEDSDSESDSESESESEYESGDEESINPSNYLYDSDERAKGLALYIRNGGTRAEWITKSDKYKDTYFDTMFGILW